MFIFKVKDRHDGCAEIRVQALDWALHGEVTFSCNRDQLALSLLSECRSGSGYFELLAGTRPMYVEQWLEYLQDAGLVAEISVEIKTPMDDDYAAFCGFSDEQRKTLLDMIYQIGGFNRLQIMRYLKHRNNPSTMSTRYNAEELLRYRQLGELINYLIKLKTPPAD